jgi:hypothetical protein
MSYLSGHLQRLDGSWSEPTRTTGYLSLFRELIALRKTGAVRVSREREQLIGGKPTEARK